MQRLLYSILYGRWLITAESANAWLPFIASLIKGESLKSRVEARPEMLVSGGLRLSYKCQDNEPFLIGPGNNMLPFKLEEAPSGSVAVLPVTDQIIMYGDGCGIRGTLAMRGDISAIEQSPNIIGSVNVYNTPGGHVSGTQSGAGAIANMSKANIGLVDGQCCSAGLWLASQHKERYMSSATDEIGSLGGYMILADNSAQLEAEGINLIEVYSDLSQDKNAEIRAALEGDTTLIKERMINPFVQEFINDVASGIGDGLNLDEVKTGKVFMAEEAKSLGLINDVGASLMDCVERVRQLSSSKSQSNMGLFSTKSKIKQLALTTAALEAGLTSDENYSEEQLTAANVELQEATGLNLVLGENLQTLFSSFQGENSPTTLTEAAAQVAALNQSLATANAEIKRLGKQPAVPPIDPETPPADPELKKDEPKAKSKADLMGEQIDNAITAAKAQTNA